MILVWCYAHRHVGDIGSAGVDPESRLVCSAADLTPEITDEG